MSSIKIKDLVISQEGQEKILRRHYEKMTKSQVIDALIMELFVNNKDSVPRRIENISYGEN